MSSSAILIRHIRRARYAISNEDTCTTVVANIWHVSLCNLASCLSPQYSARGTSRCCRYKTITMRMNTRKRQAPLPRLPRSLPRLSRLRGGRQTLCYDAQTSADAGSRQGIEGKVYHHVQSSHDQVVRAELRAAVWHPFR